MSETRFEIVALAGSAGALEAITGILRGLPADFPAPIFVLMHLPARAGLGLETFKKYSSLPVQWADPETTIRAGNVYVAPSGHAVQLEPDGTFTLIATRNSRYPIDETLQSIAESYGERAIAVIFTGMRNDGAEGVRKIKERGGIVIVQSEDTALHPSMPAAAIATGIVDLVLPLPQIASVLATVVTSGTLPASQERVAALERIFGGAGEMRAHYRSIDWTVSPLGAIETWPVELTTMLRLILVSPLPMSLSWGPEHVQFVNDAGMATLGDRALRTGQPYRLVFPEISATILPELESVRRTGAVLVRENVPLYLAQGGRLVEHFFHYTRMPVGDGAPALGVFGPFIEITDRYIAERRMATLTRLAAVPRAKAVNDAFSALLGALEDNPFDVPFALAYAIDPRATTGVLKGAVGMRERGLLAPDLIDLRSVRAPWPLASVIESRRPMVVSDLATRFAEPALGPWNEPITEAMLVPLSGIDERAPLAVLVLGLNRRRPLDHAYRTFLELLATQIGSGLSEAHAFTSSQQRADALAEANRAKTEFFSNVSHEFRTPLTLILAPLERARAADDVPAAVSDDLEIAERNARRLQGLVSALLDVAQADAHRLVPRYESIDLAAETKDIASLFRSAANDAHIALVVDCDLAKPVHIDRAMWAKIVVNLLANALKFTFEGEIVVTLRERAQHVELVVSDTGVGIADADVPHVFDRFFRSHGQRARTHEGSGIGLSLVKELVQCHGGRVRAKSELGKGSSFTVWIPTRRLNLRGIGEAPRDESDRAAALALAVDQSLAWTHPPRHPNDAVVGGPETLEGLDTFRRDTAGARVLVVDDNADMRAYLERLLREAGWFVELAADGEDAFTHASVSRPDLILSDVMMPQADGFELLRRIRADPSLRSTPLVLVTARAAESSALEGLVAGANDYVTKPFSSRELVARVGAQIQLARVRRRGERLDAYRVRLMDAIADLTDPLAIEHTGCRVLAEALGVVHVSYGDFSMDGERFRVGRDYTENTPSLVGRVNVTDFGPWYVPLREGKTLMVDDVDVEPGFEDARAAWSSVARRSGAAVPIVEDGKTVAYISAGDTGPHHWTEEEIILMRETTVRTREAIRRARAEAALRKSQEKLELQADLIDNAAEAISATDEDWKITYWNRAAEALFGWSAEEVIGRPSEEIFQTAVPGSNRKEAIAYLVEHGTYTGEATYRRKDGSRVVTEVVAAVLRKGKKGFRGTVTAFRPVTERAKG